MALIQIEPYIIDATGNFTFNDVTATGNLSSLNANLGNTATANFFIGSGNNLSNIQGANVTGQASNALIAGTVYTNAQPNITSVGTLTGLTSTGTVNLTGASNVALGPVANVHITGGSNGQYLQTDGSGTLSWSTVSSGSTSNISNGNSNVNIPSANGNINFSAVGNTVMVITGTGVNVAGTLNTGSGIITGNGNGLSSIVGANVTGQVGNSLVSGTVYTNAQPNITSVGTLSSLAVTGNTTSGNFIGILANGNSNVNIPSANGNVNISAVGNANVLIITGTGANISGTANITGNLVAGNISAGSGTGGNITGANLVSANFFTGTLTTNAQPNITNVGSLTGLTVSNATGVVDFTTTANVTLGTVANLHISGGTNGYVLSTDGSGTLSWIAQSGGGSTSNISNGNSNVNIPSANGNINFSAVGNTVMVITGTGVNVAGTLNTGTGNIIGGNIIGIIAAGANAITTTANITGGNIIGIIAAGANAITTTGNISGGNLIGVFANGNSNVSIPTANGNVNISATGVANVLVVTSTGSNITGSLNVTGNATIGNLITSGSGGNISSANVISANTFLASNTITSPQLISNVSTGTAPFVVTSTTRVGNLSVDYANVSDYGVVTTQTTGTFYPIFVNGSTTSNYAQGSNTNLSFNAATGALSATLFTGTLTTADQPNITSVGSLTGLTVSNATGVVNFTTTANVTLGAVANLHISGGTAGYYLQTDGAGTLSWAAGGGGGGGSPGGSNTQVQFNDGSTFGGNADLTFNKTTTTLTANNFVATSTANLGSNANVIITGGTNGYVLSTNGAGGLSWIASGGGGGGGASISNGTSNVDIATSGGNITMGVGGVANVVVVSTAGISAALKPRVVVIADSLSVTINADITDMATQTNTGSGTVTINAPTGTPYDGQKLLFRIRSTNSLTFSFNAIFIGSTDLAPPTVTSGGSKFDYMGWMYNTGDSKWNLISRNFGFV